MKRKSNLSVLIPLFIAGVSVSAFASESQGNDATDIANARIGLAQAVASAEHRVGGKASRAEYD